MGISRPIRWNGRGSNFGLKEGTYERDRQTHRQRQADRQTDRQTDRDRETETKRHTERQRQTNQMKSNKSLLFINIQSIKIFLGYIGSRRYI